MDEIFMPLPDKSALIGANVTEQGFKTALGDFIDNASSKDDVSTAKQEAVQEAATEADVIASEKLNQAKDFTKNEIESIFTGSEKQIDFSPIFGYAINTDIPQTSIFSQASNTRAYLRIDVKNLSTLTIKNATESYPYWKWVFCDEHDKYLSTSSEYGNETIKIPSGAYWAYRTYQVGDQDAYENVNMVITGMTTLTVDNAIQKSIEGILDKASKDTDIKLYGGAFTQVNIKQITGYSVQTGATNPAFLSPQSANDQRGYIKIDVSNASKISVSNTIKDVAVNSWWWVFETEKGEKILTSNNYDTEFNIPETAKFAYRTVYYATELVKYDDIANGLIVKLFPKSPRIQPQITKLTEDVALLMGASDAALGAYVALQKVIDKMDMMVKAKTFILPNDFVGDTQTDRLKKAVSFVKKRGIGIIELGTDSLSNTNLWTLTEAITLPSNCWIYINKATVKRGDGVFDNIFRNDGIVPDPNPFNYAKELNKNVNIRIFGNSKADSFIDGNLVGAKVAPHPVNGGNPVPWISDYYGWRAISILFANTQYHHVHDLSLINSQNWTISNEHGCSNFSYHDLYFKTTVKNGDGVNVRFGCHDFAVYNIDGNTSDDQVAINSLNNFLGQHPSGNYIYPTQVGGYADRGFGVDIYNGEVYNIKASSSAGVGMYFSGGSKIYNINVNNVQEYDVATVNWLVHINARYGVGAAMGHCYNITINNVVSNLTDKPVYLNAPLKDVWVNKVVQNKVTATPAVSTNNLYISDNVEITNVKQAV